MAKTTGYFQRHITVTFNCSTLISASSISSRIVSTFEAPELPVCVCLLADWYLERTNICENHDNNAKVEVSQLPVYLNSFDAGDRLFQLWGSIPCLLMHWLLKSPEHQQAWYWLCRTDNMYCCSRVNFITHIVVPELISSTWLKPNPWYDSKCKSIFYNL